MVHWFSLQLFLLLKKIIFDTLGLSCCAQSFSSCGKWEIFFIAGFSFWWLFSLQSTGYKHISFSSYSKWSSSCGSRALECMDPSSCSLCTLECLLSSCGTQDLLSPQHVESTWIRDQTHFPCLGRQSLIHCMPMEVLYFYF